MKPILPAPQGKDKNNYLPGSCLSFIKTFTLAVLCAVIVRSFLFEPFHIPSGSMKPRLLIGDYIFVSKYSYGYSKYSFPFSLNIFSGRIGGHSPKRGEVVVFRLPSDPAVNYIKRIVGLPGDQIQVREGQLFINQKAVPRAYIDDFIDDQGIKIKEYKETLPEGGEFIVLDQYENTPQDNTGVYTVPEGHYFVMGDNRDNSQDSRFLLQVGYVPQENLVGRAEIIFFSIDGDIWRVWEWSHSIRFGRFFKKIN